MSDASDIGMVIGLIVTVAVLAIGVFILFNFQENLSDIASNSTDTSSKTVSSVVDAGWNSLAFLAILPLITGAFIVVFSLFNPVSRKVAAVRAARVPLDESVETVFTAQLDVAKLQCSNCGSPDLCLVEGEVYRCEHCGHKYKFKHTIKPTRMVR